MKNKKLVCITLVLMMISSFTAMASTNHTPEKIAEWETNCRMKSNPIAEYEGLDKKAKSNLVLVESDVWMEYSGAGSAGFGAGYTTVQTKSGEDAYHYTRVEVRRGNKVLAKKKEYGKGRVYAETDDVEGAVNMDDVYAKVFWGEK